MSRLPIISVRCIGLPTNQMGIQGGHPGSAVPSVPTSTAKPATSTSATSKVQQIFRRFFGGPSRTEITRLFRPNLVRFRRVFETLLPCRVILLALPTGKRIPDIIGSNVEQT